MRFGDFEIHLLRAGGWRPDGGSMFGVIPKVLWEKRKPADGMNLITAACTGAVIRKGGRTIVVETGIGTKLPEKRALQFRVWEPEGLLTSLNALGIRPDEVDVVLSTHLHWDHAGGMTRRGAGGGYELTFPKARHFVQRAEWDFALQPDVRSAAAYIAEDFLPVEAAGLVEFVEGSVEPFPGVELRLTGGHTPGHCVPVFTAGDAVFAIAGDLVPTAAHLRLPWTMSADLDPLRLLEEKAKLLTAASDHRWLLLLGHEDEAPAGYLDPEGGWTPESALEPGPPTD